MLSRPDVKNTIQILITYSILGVLFFAILMFAMWILPLVLIGLVFIAIVDWAFYDTSLVGLKRDLSWDNASVYYISFVTSLVFNFVLLYIVFLRG